MFVAISPLKSNHVETLSSLDFGQIVKQVKLGKAPKHSQTSFIVLLKDGNPNLDCTLKM